MIYAMPTEIVTKQSDTFFTEGRAHPFEDQPKNKQSCHLQVRVCEPTSWVGKQDDGILDVGGPLPAENDGCTVGEFPNDDTANPLARCVYYSDVIWQSRDQFSTPCWFFGRFTEEGSTPLHRREYCHIPLQIYIWWVLLENAVARR
jgi:hypothetical protein